MKYRTKKTGSGNQQADKRSSCRLYNLAEDVGEQNNLVDKHPDVVQQIINFLKRDGLL